MKPLSKANSIVSARLRHIFQCGLPWTRLKQILVEVTNRDSDFVKWLNENGYDDIVTKNKYTKQSAYSKQDYTRFPWFDDKGKLMVKESVTDEMERIIAITTPS